MTQEYAKFGLVHPGLGGVIKQGALSYESRPAGAAATVIDAGISNAEGAAVTPIAASVVPVDFWVTHLTQKWSGTNYPHDLRYRLRQNDDPYLRELLFTSLHWRDGTSATDWYGGSTRSFPPMLVKANQALKAVLTTDHSAATQMQFFAQIMRGTPVLDLALLRRLTKSVLRKHPTDQAGGVAVTAPNGTWGWSGYVELTAGFASDALITAVMLSGNLAGQDQVALATGPVAAEVDFGTWAAMGRTSNQNRSSFHHYDLSPFPFLLPANTRLAARCRGSVAETVDVAFEYFSLPLAAA